MQVTTTRTPAGLRIEVDLPHAPAAVWPVVLDRFGGRGEVVRAEPGRCLEVRRDGATLRWELARMVEAGCKLVFTHAPAAPGHDAAWTDALRDVADRLAGRHITFRALTEADLPLLHGWLVRPHVAEWWGETPSLDDVRADYLPRLAPDDVLPADAPAGVQQYLACEGDHPVAFVQAYRVMAHQADGWWPDETDPFALGTDQFIGLPDRLGQGLGTRMLKAFLAFLFEDPRVTTVQTDPAPGNARAIAAYRKAGFRDVGEVATPDGPALLLRARREDVVT